MAYPTVKRDIDARESPTPLKTEQNARNTQGDREPQKAKPLIEEKKYKGWTNWSTWNVIRLIDSVESTHNAKRRLALNALKKGIGIDQLTDQFGRMFKKQEDETKKICEENAASARAERQQIESKNPEPYGNTAKHTAEGPVEKWSGMGGISGWEEPMGEVNWREIAWNAAESEEMEIKAQGYESMKKAPEFTEHDKGMLKSFGISTALHTSVQTEGTQPIPEHSNNFVSSVSGSVEAMRCSQCGEMLSTDRALRKQHLETRHPGKLFHLVWKVQGHKARTTKA